MEVKNKKILLIIDNSYEMHKFYEVISLFNNKGYKVDINRWKNVLFRSIRSYDYILVYKYQNNIYKKILRTKTSSPIIYLNELHSSKTYGVRKNEAVMICKNDHSLNFVNLFILLSELKKVINLEISIFIQSGNNSIKKIHELISKLNISDKVRIYLGKNELLDELRKSYYYFSFYDDDEEHKIIEAAKDRGCKVIRFLEEVDEIQIDETLVDISDLEATNTFLKSNFSIKNFYGIRNFDDTNVGLIFNELHLKMLSKDNSNKFKVSNL